MEMLMFSGLEAQGEMNRLLDKMYASLEEASLTKRDDAQSLQKLNKIRRVSRSVRPSGGPSVTGW